MLMKYITYSMVFELLYTVGGIFLFVLEGWKGFLRMQNYMNIYVRYTHRKEELEIN